MNDDRVEVICPECGEPQYNLSREKDGEEIDFLEAVDEFMVYDGEMCCDCQDLLEREQEEYDREEDDE